MDSAGANGGLLMERVIRVPWRIGENGPCHGMCNWKSNVGRDGLSEPSVGVGEMI
jgi:hypothetical protein